VRQYSYAPPPVTMYTDTFLQWTEVGWHAEENFVRERKRNSAPAGIFVSPIELENANGNANEELS
jgi:hypothetical protein